MKINKTFIYFLIFSYILLLPFSLEHFGLDSYAIMHLPANEHAAIYLASGRLIMFLMIYITEWLNLAFHQITYISFIIAIVSIAYSMYIIYDKIGNRIIDTYSRCLISVMMVLSPLVIQLFFFPEFTGIQFLAIMLAIKASIVLDTYIDTKNRNTLIYSMILMLLSVLSYQSAASYFIVLFSVWQLDRHSNYKYYIHAFSIYTISALISVVLAKLFESTKLTTASATLVDKIMNILWNMMHIFLTMYSVFPLRTTQLLIISLFIYAIFTGYKANKLLPTTLTLLLCIAMPFAPHLASATLGDAPRIVMGVALIIAISAYIILIFTPNKTIKLALICVLTLFTLQQYRYWSLLTTDHFKVNALDQVELQIYLDIINDYSKQNTLNHVVFIDDQSPTQNFPGILSLSDTNSRIGFVSWALIPQINHLLSLDLKLVEWDEPNDIEDLINFCEDRNWDELDKEQINVNNDTLVICRY